VFQPVPIYNRYLVDGGLTANLPFFLFEEEQRVNRVPTLAFDLIEPPAPATEKPGFDRFLGDLAATALQSAQRLHLDRFRDVYVVQVDVPIGISAFTRMPQEQQEQLFWLGYESTERYLREPHRPWNEATNQVSWLQALYAPPHLVEPLLRAYTDEIHRLTGATNLRANLMLPTGVGRFSCSRVGRVG
jgi:NTE family protein